MPVISVMYPGADSAKFDHDYYMQTHIPLVRDRWSPHGLQDIKIMRGVHGPDGLPPTFVLMALLTFASMDEFKAAADQHGKEIFADIPNFTDAKPVLQFNEAA